MKITDAKVIVCSPGRNFVTLKIVTEDGLTGLGDATLNGRELAVATYLSEHVVPLLVGRDARRIEDTWHYLYKGVYWRKGAVTMTAIAAVDMALWDIAGKAANKPVYRAVRWRVAGRRARLQPRQRRDARSDDDGGCGSRETRISGDSRAVHDTRATRRLRRRHGGAPLRAGRTGGYRRKPLGTEPYLQFTPVLFDRLRREFGPDLHLLHDVHHRLRPIEAARLGKSLEPYHLFWMEDAVPAELQEGSARFASTRRRPLRWAKSSTASMMAID